MRLKASLGLVLGLLTAPAVWGQDVKPAVSDKGAHRMEIYDGPTRTVAYFPTKKDASPGERQMYRDLERAENEESYVANLQALRRQYLAGERMLETRRQLEQQQLYGWNFDKSYSAGYLGTSYAPYGYPYYGYGSYGGGSFATANVAISQTLGTGIGPEGVIKQEIAKVIAHQSTPEYTAAVDRQLERAVAALTGDGKPAERYAAYDPQGPPRMGTVLLKGGDKLEGKLLYEDPEWIVVQTAAGAERVRMSEVTRVIVKVEKK
jgi:hypothetical protein